MAWVCPNCSSNNDDSSLICMVCDRARHDDASDSDKKPRAVKYVKKNNLALKKAYRWKKTDQH